MNNPRQFRQQQEEYLVRLWNEKSDCTVCHLRKGEYATLDPDSNMAGYLCIVCFTTYVKRINNREDYEIEDVSSNFN